MNHHIRNAIRGSRGIGLAVLLALLAMGCSSVPPIPDPLGVDPVLNWDAVTQNCIGEPVTVASYNVYAVSGPGPVPTVASARSEPCGVVQLATGTPLNTAPITSTTYHAIVPNGVWTFAIESVLADGTRSQLSAGITLTVLNRGGAPVNVRVGSP